MLPFPSFESKHRRASTHRTAPATFVRGVSAYRSEAVGAELSVEGGELRVREVSGHRLHPQQSEQKGSGQSHEFFASGVEFWNSIATRPSILEERALDLCHIQRVDFATDLEQLRYAGHNAFTTKKMPIAFVVCLKKGYGVTSC